MKFTRTLTAIAFALCLALFVTACIALWYGAIALGLVTMGASFAFVLAFAVVGMVVAM